MPQTFEVGEIFFLCLKISSWMIFNLSCHVADDSSRLKFCLQIRVYNLKDILFGTGMFILSLEILNQGYY